MVAINDRDFTTLASGSWTYGSARVNFYSQAKRESTYDIVNNRTKIYTRLYWEATYSIASYGVFSYITNGGEVQNGYVNFQGSGVLRSWEGWVYHNADGTGSYTMDAWVGATGLDLATGKFTGVAELPTIPRASVPTCSPNPLTIGSSGATLTVNTNRKASAFTHTIKVQCGSWSWTSSARAVGASVNVTVPYSVIAQFSATSKTATATITCTTFNGTTQIGSAQTCSCTFQINTSVDHPNVGTITISDTNSRTHAVVNDNTKYVAYMSTLTASIPLTVSGSYTQLASATVTCGTKTQNYTLSGTSQTISFTFAKVNANKLTVTVKDKRGNTASGSKTWTLLAYSPLTLTGTVGRPSATGSTAVGQVSGVAYGGSYGASTNSLTISYRYKEHDASSWTDGAETFTKTLNNGQQTYTQAMTFSEEFDYQKQYDVQFTVSDLFSTVTYTAQLMQGLPILSWDETEVDVWGSLHIHDRDNPTSWQDVMEGFDASFEHGGYKNLLVPTETTVTRNGITYTRNGDGSWTVNGTATEDSYGVVTNGFTFLPFHFPVTLSGCPKGGTYDTYYLQFYWYNGSDIARDYGDGVTITPSGTTARNVAIYVRKGVTMNNLVFRPMLRDARLASDTFVPYIPRLPLVVAAWASSTAYTATSSTGTIMVTRTVPVLKKGRYLILAGGALYVNQNTGNLQIKILSGGTQIMYRTVCGTNSTNNTNSVTGMIFWTLTETDYTNVSIQFILAAQDSSTTATAPAYRQRWFAMIKCDDGSPQADVYL